MSIGSAQNAARRAVNSAIQYRALPRWRGHDFLDVIQGSANPGKPGMLEKKP